jgi:hypothetical protein
MLGRGDVVNRDVVRSYPSLVDLSEAQTRSRELFLARLGLGRHARINHRLAGETR